MSAWYWASHQKCRPRRSCIYLGVVAQAKQKWCQTSGRDASAPDLKTRETRNTLSTKSDTRRAQAHVVLHPLLRVPCVRDRHRRSPLGKTARTLTQQNSRSGRHLKRRKRPSKTRTSKASVPRTSRGPTCKTTRSRPKTRDAPEIQDTNRTARPCLQGERRETTSRLTSTPQQIHRRGTKPLIHDGGKKPLSDWKSSRHEPLHDTSSCHHHVD